MSDKAYNGFTGKQRVPKPHALVRFRAGASNPAQRCDYSGSTVVSSGHSVSSTPANLGGAGLMREAANPFRVRVSEAGFDPADSIWTR